MKAQDYQISSEKFKFRSMGDALHDGKLQTKPVGYFKDAMYRFTKNKASIVAFFIIMILVLFAIFGPLFTPYTVGYHDATYKNCTPKSAFFSQFGFWDGRTEKETNEQTYRQNMAIEQEIGRDVVVGEAEIIHYKDVLGKDKVKYKYVLDTYNQIGCTYELLSPAEFEALQRYQDEYNVQVLYPAIDPAKRPEALQDQNNANYWYLTKKGDGNKTEPIYDADGEFINAYKEFTGEDKYFSKMRIEGDTALYEYAIVMQGGQLNVRVDYYQYYIYKHTQILKDGITEPVFWFGTNDGGKDLFVCLASGARFSFILAIIVASINLVVGAIYGAIEGYYGGKIDLIMERFCDILGAIPFMIVITLIRYHLDASHVVVLFISFFLTGWMGMAGRTRMQFYRFKNQEYVLVARTLGANDRRIMFKHIFPNAIGTLITGSVLVIPSVIFSETSLSYLGIINLETGNVTSVGTLLAAGQSFLYTFPHMIVFPSIFISLLMLSFNLFGNGLRDAFNPSLRGTEE